MSQLVFALCELSREATNINLKVFDLTRMMLKPAIYHSQGEHANHFVFALSSHLV